MMEQEINQADWAIELMKKRQSVRSFKDVPIQDNLLKNLLEVGINAATGGNLQPYSIIVEKDPKHKKKLAELCGAQTFIAHAAVDLLFLLDFHKLAIYSRKNDAPFTCNKSFDHYSIAMDDVLCAAQSIETAAWFHGIGSCYVGTILDCIPECVRMYDLPMLVAPVLVLSLGYPKGMAARRKKLEYEMVVFEETYPQLSIETICAAFDKKYQGMKTPLPKEPLQQKEMLDAFRRALETTYNAEKCEQIIQTAQEQCFITEIQRRFGLHYHAEDQLTPKTIEDLANCGIYPFYSWNKSNH